MSKIAIYKPFKKVFFVDDREDTAAWSFEVVTVAKIFAERGHTVYMLSETDLKGGEFPNIHVGSMKEKYDRIILFSGSFSLDPAGDSIIDKLRVITPRLDFLLTDLRLVPSTPTYYDKFDNIYTQATLPLEDIGGQYGGVAEFLPYKHEFKCTVEEAIKRKNIEFYFGGTERGRLDDFIEYVWRPEHTITTKTEFFNLNNRVTRDQYMILLEYSKFSIVIADVEYNENHFITPRPFENWMHDIIGFVDQKFDPDGHLVATDDWLRVSNYKEMKEKIEEVKKNPSLHVSLLKSQREMITQAITSGDYVYSLLS